MYPNSTMTGIDILDGLSHVLIWSSKCDFIHEKYIKSTRNRIHEQGRGRGESIGWREEGIGEREDITKPGRRGEGSWTIGGREHDGMVLR